MNMFEQAKHKLRQTNNLVQATTPHPPKKEEKRKNFKFLKFQIQITHWYNSSFKLMSSIYLVFHFIVSSGIDLLFLIRTIVQ